MEENSQCDDSPLSRKVGEFLLCRTPADPQYPNPYYWIHILRLGVYVVQYCGFGIDRVRNTHWDGGGGFFSSSSFFGRLWRQIH